MKFDDRNRTRGGKLSANLLGKWANYNANGTVN